MTEAQTHQPNSASCMYVLLLGLSAPFRLAHDHLGHPGF